MARRIIVGLSVVGIAVFLTLRFAPLTQVNFASSDSAVFLYMGRQILGGHLPYRDAWDQKPPLVYYLNALGLLVGRGSAWGVWALACLAVIAAAALCYAAAARCYGGRPAVFALACFAAATFATMEHANSTEVYALPLQFGLIALFVGREQHGVRRWPFVLAGALTALLFLLQQNLIATGAAVALGGFLSPPRKGFRASIKSGLYMLFGFAGVVGLSAVYFAAAGALSDFYDAAFSFNFLYTGSPWPAQLHSIVWGVRLTSAFGVLFLAAAGVLVALLSRLQGHTTAGKRLLIVCMIALPLEVALSSLPGRPYGHYFLTWAPSLSLLGGSLAWTMTAFARQEPLALWGSYKVHAGALLAWIAVILVSARLLVAGVSAYRGKRLSDAPFGALAGYVDSRLRSTDRMFVWGYVPEVYWICGRSAPSRFFFIPRC